MNTLRECLPAHTYGDWPEGSLADLPVPACELESPARAIVSQLLAMRALNAHFELRGLPLCHSLADCIEQSQRTDVLDSGQVRDLRVINSAANAAKHDLFR